MENSDVDLNTNIQNSLFFVSDKSIGPVIDKQ